MTRPKKFKEQLSFLNMEGIVARLEAVRGPRKEADVLLEAVERELRRLENGSKWARGKKEDSPV